MLPVTKTNAIVTAASPKNLPSTTSPRRSGRGKMASAIPPSTSLPIAAAPRNAAPIARTIPNMCASKMICIAFATASSPRLIVAACASA
jgi:hypothetical protein